MGIWSFEQQEQHHANCCKHQLGQAQVSQKVKITRANQWQKALLHVRT